MNKIKNYVIHLLGGITVEESALIAYDSNQMGKYIAFSSMRQFADSINGTPADEWCKVMYDKICDSAKHVIEDDNRIWGTNM